MVADRPDHRRRGGVAGAGPVRLRGLHPAAAQRAADGGARPAMAMAFPLRRAGGKLGTTDVRYISNDNPFGLNPADPNGRDNYLIDSPEVHLPLNRPVGSDPVARRAARLLRPAVPGTHEHGAGHGDHLLVHADPGRALRHPVRAALRDRACRHARCGGGRRRSRVLALAGAATTFAQQQMAHVQAAPAAAGGGTGAGQAWAGRSRRPGAASPAIPWTAARSWVPAWKGLYGKTETMADGSTAKVDETYLRAFIRNPTARVVKGLLADHAALRPERAGTERAGGLHQGARRDSRQHRGPALAERTQQTEHTP